MKRREAIKQNKNKYIGKACQHCNGLWRYVKNGLCANGECWYKRNKDKNKIARDKYRKTRKGKLSYQKYRLKVRYEISIDEFNRLSEEQNNRCKICNRKEKTKQLAVDHDHKTGKVRGLLCERCNRGLGHFNDDPQVLEKAKNYLLTM